nr:hypothetical protein [Candidatus Njordarchaeota archaeon]
MNGFVEENLRRPIHRFLENKNYAVFDEVRLFSRRIDIIAKRKNNLVSVELKLRDWRKAILQAYLNLRVSDYSLIALPEQVLNRVTEAVRSEVRHYGIGLLSVNGVVMRVVKPIHSTRIQPNLRRVFLKNLVRGE